MKNKKKIILIASISAAVLLVAGGLVWLLGGTGSSGQKAYVQKVSNILGGGSLGAQNRFAGLVEAQKTLKIDLDSSKTLLEVFVEEGQEVKAGDPLFSYDVDELKLNLEQLKLELESTKNSITTMNNQIAALKKEKANAPKDEQLQYTIQIQTLEVNIMQAEYTIKTKTNEIEKAQNSIEHAVVTSEIDGVVRKINRGGGNGNQPNYGGEQDTSFMTIMATGSFRVKGLVSEQFVSSIYEGMSVIVRSRTDESQVWRGIVKTIDTDNPISGGNSGGMYDGGMGGKDETTTASKYPFYIELESSEGLMMGQHVYIEPDMGQGTQKEGLWLPGYYLLREDDKAFVYAANGRNKIEKRSLQLGGYDEATDTYEILDGLTLEDRIAFPEEFIEAGMGVTDSPDYNNGGNAGEPDAGLPEGNGPVIGEGNVVGGDTDMGIMPRDAQMEPAVSVAPEE